MHHLYLYWPSNLADRLELDYIEQGLLYFKKSKSFSGKYPFLEDPKTTLTDNRSQDIAYGRSLEKTLAKKNLREQFTGNLTNLFLIKSMRS